MQALHDQNDRRVLGVVFAAFQRGLKPVQNTLADRVAAGLGCLVRVVNYDGAAESFAVFTGTKAGQRATRTRGIHHTACRGFPVGLGGSVEFHIWEDFLIRLMQHQEFGIGTVVCSQIAGIADMDEFTIRNFPHGPSNEVNHCQLRFGVTRRDV